MPKSPLDDIHRLKQAERNERHEQWMEDWFHRNFDPSPPKRPGLTVNFSPGCVLALVALVAFAAGITAALLW